jgi:alkylhydroperoxidase family enzyme
VTAALADYRSAPLSGKLKRTLAFLEKLTLMPEAVGPADVLPLRQEGLSDQAIEDAIHVCAMFNIFDRLADAMGWEVPADPDFWRKQSRYLLKFGYQGGKQPSEVHDRP